MHLSHIKSLFQNATHAVFHIHSPFPNYIPPSIPLTLLLSSMEKFCCILYEAHINPIRIRNRSVISIITNEGNKCSSLQQIF